MELKEIEQVAYEAAALIKKGAGADKLDNPDDILAWMLELVQIQPTLAYAQSCAKKLLNDHKLEVTLKNKEESATVLKMIVAGKTSETNKVVEFIEQIIHDNSKSIEALRTAISLKKVEMEQANYGGA